MDLGYWLAVGYLLAGLLCAAWAWDKMMRDENIQKALDTAPMSERAARAALWFIGLVMCALVTAVWPVWATGWIIKGLSKK